MHRWSLAVLAYSAVLTTCTVMDRLDHGQFASSDFCQSKSSVDNAGRFGAHHCMGALLSHLDSRKSKATFKF